MRFVALVLLFVLPAAPAQADFFSLLGAARLGDTALVRQQLAAGDSPNPPSYHHSYTPLQFAAGNGHVEMTRLLLAAGADTEYRDHNGDRALLWAAQDGHAETVALLLAAGSPADSDADPYGKTPLMAAAGYGRTDVVLRLLAAGADVHRMDQSGDTALHLAARTDDLDLVRALLEAGANPNVYETILYQTPLHEAAVWSSPAMVKLLLDAGAGPDARDQDGRTPLFRAAGLGNAGSVAALIAGYAEIDAPDLAGQTPILAAMAAVGGEGDRNWAGTVTILAAYTRDLDRGFAAALGAGLPAAALTLLERGADIDALDENGRSALASTVQLPGLTWFQLLLNRGADLERFGAGTLLEAAANGRTDIARALIERGIAVDSPDARGATPLLLAAKGAHVETVRFLLAAGAEKVPVDDFGLGVPEYFDIVPDFYEATIEQRAASRAWRPTEHLEIDLAAIRERQAEIRKLLAEN
jgi:ankyrin repeat protein